MQTKGGGSGGGGKSDALNVLLSYVGGVNDVPNVFLIGATNFKSMLDAAFLRYVAGPDDANVVTGVCCRLFSVHEWKSVVYPTLKP